MFSTRPNLSKALVALRLAAKREPEAYAQTYQGLETLLDQALDDAVSAELRAHDIPEIIERNTLLRGAA